MDGLGFFRSRERAIVYSREHASRPLCMFRILEDIDANITLHFFVIVERHSNQRS